MVKVDQPKSLKNADSVECNGELTPEMLVRDHSSAVRAVCLVYARNIHDSEDLMQEVFLKAVIKISSLRDTKRARPWLLQIARRICIDHHRKKHYTQRLSDDIPAQNEAISPEWAQLHRALVRLPDEYREVVSLYYLDGRKCARVAEMLGISDSAVRQRLVRARLMLHDMLVEDKK